MVKITLLTWNCGNASATNETFALLHKKLFQDHWVADIVVIGLQESCREGAKFGVIGGHSLTERLATSEGVRGNYQKILSHSMIGLTKPGQENPNAQHLGVLSKGRGIRANVGSERTSSSGKGAVFGNFSCEGINITAITSHLDSNSDVSRNVQIDKIMNKVSTMSSSSCFFFMGDLNYRVVRAKLPSVQIAEKDDRQLSEALSIPQKRRALWETNNLQESSLVQKHGFYFPIPPEVFLPTYKYPEKGALLDSRKTLVQILNREIKIANQDFVAQAFISQAIKNCLLVNKKDKGRGEIEMGWLDQIGYKDDYVDIKVIEYTSLQDVMQSDHLPVIMRAEISPIKITRL